MTPEEKSLLTRAFHILSRVEDGKPVTPGSLSLWKADYEKLMKKNKQEVKQLLFWNGEEQHD